MKQTFNLDHPRIKAPRVVDSIKHDIKKHLKKERRQELPLDASHWGFECKVGASEESAVEVHLSLLTKTIDELVANGDMTIHVEISTIAIERPYSEETSEEVAEGTDDGDVQEVELPEEVFEEALADSADEAVEAEVEEDTDSAVEDDIDDNAEEDSESAADNYYTRKRD